MKKIILCSVILVLFTTHCFAYQYGYITEDSTGRNIKTFVQIKNPPLLEEGETLTYCSEEELSNIELYAPLSYNDKRFKTSLLADETINAFGVSPFYAMLSDCLRDKNWDALNIVLGMMIASEAGTQEQVDYFKAKILEEEGVSL